VIAASGGFQANIEWLRESWGPAADNFRIRGTPYAKGRVLRRLLDQGVGSVGDPTQCHAVAIDGHLAWVTLDENLVDTAGTGTVAATNLYADRGDGWRLLVHHGSPVLSRPA
jgi:hypothetical protein